MPTDTRLEQGPFGYNLPPEDIVKFYRETFRQRYGPDLVNMARSIENLRRLIESHDSHLQKFALEYLTVCEFHDDRVFFDFATDYLAHGSDVDLRISSVRFLSAYFAHTGDVSVLVSLTKVMRNVLEEAQEAHQLGRDNRLLLLFANFVVLQHIDGVVETSPCTYDKDVDKISIAWIDQLEHRIHALGHGKMGCG